MTVAVNEEKCLGCSLCVLACPEEAVAAHVVAKINDEKCIECLECINNCPADAIEEVLS